MSNATSERAFSALTMGLRRLKTYLRSSLSQESLNNCVLLHVHKKETDAINTELIMKDFISRNVRRENYFGKN